MTEDKELPEVIQGLVRISQNLKWDDSRKSEPEDFKNNLRDALKKWRNTLIPGAKEAEGQIIIVTEKVRVVLAGEESVKVTGERDNWIDLLVPVTDGLRVKTEGSEFVFNVKERKLGGSQLEVSKVDGADLKVAELDARTMHESISALEQGNLHKSVELKEKAIHRKTFSQIVLTAGDGVKNFIHAMKGEDDFRVDEVAGGLVSIKCWGVVEFKVGV